MATSAGTKSNEMSGFRRGGAATVKEGYYLHAVLKTFL